MNPADDTTPPAKGQILVYSTEEGQTKIEVQLENETVWLTQQHMADLFQTTQQNTSLHLQNIYDEGELRRQATHKEFLSVRQEGTRQVRRPIVQVKATIENLRPTHDLLLPPQLERRVVP